MELPNAVVLRAVAVTYLEKPIRKRNEDIPAAAECNSRILLPDIGKQIVIRYKS